ncbi:acyl carrier protein [Cohnella boryungensis]|uniref:Acyl carrier protein n=1 Tax=Cohnella boryungensis TaxID=768479 RepID=A0ABV8SA93_9BACL
MKVLGEMGLPSPDHEQTDLLEIGLDSVAFLNLIVNLEREFSIAIPDDDLLFDNFRTVALIEDYLTQAEFTVQP